MKKILFHIIYICSAILPIESIAQNQHNIKADIQRAVIEFFYKVSEMNNPIEPIRPENIAAAYQKGINVFQVNNGDYNLARFLYWYKDSILKDYSISHHVLIKSIERFPENNRYLVRGVLQRKIEDDKIRRRIRDENLTLKVIWRGEELNNISIQSINFKLHPVFVNPNIVKEYELSVNPVVSHLPSYGGRWKTEISSVVKSMEGFDDEERTCVEIHSVNVLYYDQDEIGVTPDNWFLKGYIGPNKSKKPRCFLIYVEQKESGKFVAYYIYQEGKSKR